jgi:hypothetical protein
VLAIMLLSPRASGRSSPGDETQARAVVPRDVDGARVTDVCHGAERARPKSRVLIGGEHQLDPIARLLFVRSSPPGDAIGTNGSARRSYPEPWPSVPTWEPGASKAWARAALPRRVSGAS